MLNRLWVLAIVGVAAVIMSPRVDAAETPSIWFCEELYTNFDGSVQFLMFWTDLPGQQYLSGQTIWAASGKRLHTYTFPSDLPGETANRRFLVATEGFRDLHVLTPDYVVPNGFLFLDDGAVSCVGNPYPGHTRADYARLPTDGVTAYHPACDDPLPGCIWTATAVNYARQAYTFTQDTLPPTPPPTSPPSPPGPFSNVPIRSVPVVEYYHAAFNHYFITALPREIAILDRGIIAGWSRTGLEFGAFVQPVSGTSPVCRFFSAAFAETGAHFQTPLASECAAVRKHAEWSLESDEAFYVFLPNADGTCGGRRRPVFRLYNNGETGAPNHRYTTDVAVREQMIAQGWIAEGIGPDAVVICSES